MCESLDDAHLYVLTYLEPDLEADGAKMVIHERVHNVILALCGNVRESCGFVSHHRPCVVAH